MSHSILSEGATTIGLATVMACAYGTADEKKTALCKSITAFKRSQILWCMFCTALLVALSPSVAAAERTSAQPVLRLGSLSSTIISAAWSQTVAHDQILREELARQGVTLVLKHFANSQAIAAAFAANEVDVGPQTELSVFKSVVESDAKGVGLLGFSYAAVVARNAIEPKDLVGAHVAVIPKTVGALTLAQMLDAAGMDASQIVEVALQVPAMQSALETGQVDAVAMWEPTPQQILRAHPEYRVLYRNASASLLVMRNALLRDRPQVARAVAAAYLRACRWWNAHDANMLKAVEWALNEGRDKAAPPQKQVALLEGVQNLRRSVTGVLGVPLLPLGWTSEKGEAQQKFDFLSRRGRLAVGQQWQDTRQRFDRSLMQSILKDSAHYQLLEFRYD